CAPDLAGPSVHPDAHVRGPRGLAARHVRPHVTGWTSARRPHAAGDWWAARGRVAIITKSFLPQVNGGTHSVVRTLEQLRTAGHEALVLAPGEPPPRVHGARVVPMRSIPLPGYAEVRVAVPTTRSVARELASFAPDVVHLASPFATGRPAVRAAAAL